MPYFKQSGNNVMKDMKECNILSIFKSKLKTFLKDLS